MLRMNIYQSISQHFKSILFLGSNNKLYYPKPDLTDTSNPVYPSIGAFRAYFQLDGIEAGEVREARLFFGNSEATGIKDVERSTMNVQRDDAWFMLDGLKLQGKPTKKGLYIRNGRKVVIQ